MIKVKLRWPNAIARIVGRSSTLYRAYWLTLLYPPYSDAIRAQANSVSSSHLRFTPTTLMRTATF